LRRSRARGTTGRSRAWEARRPSRRSRAPTEIGPSYAMWGRETGRLDERSSWGAGAGATGSAPFAGEREAGPGACLLRVLARVTEAAGPICTVTHMGQ
jgi:hypothetical protein